MLARPLARLGVLTALLAALALVAVPLAGAAGKAAKAPEEQLTPVIGNPVASPEPVLTSNGRRQLAYELQLINRTQSVATVKSLQALAGAKVVETLSGAKLLEEMAPYGQPEHSISLQPGQGAFVLMDVSLPAKAKVPALLTHRIKVSLKPAQPTIASTYELAPTTVTRPASEAVVVAPPLRGPGWVVGNGCCADFNAHRGTVLPVNGAAHVAERFAIDFVQLNSQNKLFLGARDQLANYPYFGDPIYSAAAGKVVERARHAARDPADRRTAERDHRGAGGRQPRRRRHRPRPLRLLRPHAAGEHPGQGRAEAEGRPGDRPARQHRQHRRAAPPLPRHGRSRSALLERACPTASPTSRSKARSTTSARSRKARSPRSSRVGLGPKRPSCRSTTRS